MPALPLLVAAALAAAKVPPPPSTPRRVEVEVHHGTAVEDPYRWLERGGDPEVEAWTRAQDLRTRRHLARFPGMAGLRARVKELLLAPLTRYRSVSRRGSAWFALKTAPPRAQPQLVALASPDDLASERVVVDPVALDPSGETTIDFFEPSPDGRLVAVSLSRKGSESGDLAVVEVASGEPLSDRIPRVNGGTAGGSVAWAAGSEGFWYTRYPGPEERPAADLPFFQEVWFHRLGAPVEQDAYELGREVDDPRIAEHFLQSSDDGARALDLVQKGDGGEYELHVRRPEGGWRKVAGLADGVVAARLGPDGGIWLLSRKDAPRGRILRLDADAPDLARAEVIAEASGGAIDDLEVTATRLYLAETVGGPTTIRVLDLGGRPLGTLPTEPVTGASGLRRTGPGEVVFRSTSYVAPASWWRVEDGAEPRRLALSGRSPADFSDVEVVRETATSRDGTRVPMTVLRRRGAKLDGKGPALLQGYGGYGISSAPAFDVLNRVLLDHGFVVAYANLRGGGEWGEEWHRAGYRTRKQNVFDDMAACARHLAERGYARPARLALEGASNGGLLMGAMITQHPALARAVIAEVGVFDMIRSETSPNGAFNVTEYGSVADPEEFRALLAYSPYHRVVDGTAYPAVLLTAGANDPRVDAWHAKKMAARLQAATSSPHPVLLRVSGFGHGMGTPLAEVADEAADVLAFAFEQLGVAWGGSTPAARKRR